MTKSVDHPVLTDPDAESVRKFLRVYDQYTREVKERAAQLHLSGAVTTETVRPVSLKFSVDAEYVKAALTLGIIDGAQGSYEDLAENVLRKHLETLAAESEETISLEKLDTIVQEELQMNMKDSSARSRMQSLFVAYIALLKRHGVAWLVETNQKVAVYHVLTAVRPVTLKNRLLADLEFSKHSLKKDFKGFMGHAVKLSAAFELVDNGPKQKSDRSSQRTQTPSGGAPPTSKTQPVSGRPLHGSNSHKERRPPPCPYGPCKARDLKHLTKDCPAASDDEKTRLRAELAAKRAARQSAGGDGPKLGKPRVAGRLQKNRRVKPESESSPSCKVTLSDGRASLDVRGRCDDGSDDTVISPSVAETAALKGIGKLTSIDPVRLQVALKSGEEAQTFTFSRTWHAPRTIMHLASGQLALSNATYLVADEDLACEDLLIGLPVLHHLQVDTRTLLKRNRIALDGSDCSNVGNPSMDARSGSISRMIICLLNRVVSKPTDNKPELVAGPSVHYNVVRTELDPLDADQHDDIQAAIGQMLQSAENKGLQPKQSAQLAAIVSKCKNIFRTSFSSGPPAKLPHLKIETTENAKPVKVRLPNYSQEQKTFLREFVADLVRCNMAYPNPSASWAAVPLLVPKAGPARFRFTVDLRPINACTVKHQFPMPNIENELTKLGGATCFATFDLSHGYWQLELDSESQDIQSFITLYGIYSPTRVLHGTTNAVAYLQSTLSAHLPPVLADNIMLWLDDILLYSSSVSTLMDSISVFFNFCAEHNLRLRPGKCVLYATSIRWCGRSISAEGIKYDPSRLKGLLDMTSPTNGTHLQQFLCALQWVKHGIPSFARLTEMLHLFMEQVYTKAGKRTKASVGRVQSSALGWTVVQEQAFAACKKALARQVTLAHRDEGKRLSVYTDASDDFRSGIVTQVLYTDLTIPHIDKRHEPLPFLSGRFAKQQTRWSTLKKEAYAVLDTLERMHWLLATNDGFDLFTDHNNLIFLFDPTSVTADIGQGTIQKVLRWAVRLTMYNYVCFHIKGEDNVWADLLGRWSTVPIVRRLVRVPVLPSSSKPDFVWPTSTELESVQAQSSSLRPANLHLVDKLWRNSVGAIWIPPTASDLQLRLCVIAHTGPSGHRAANSTEHTLRENFFWNTMTSDIRTFVRACIHCLSTTGGDRVPRPYGPGVHGTSPNSLLQFDFVELGESYDEAKYVLMLRDDHSNYCWFFPCADTSAEHTARAVVDWCASFGVPEGLMSDGPTHFKNETVRGVTKALKAPHHFTLPYAPWSNGGVERLGKELIRTLRAIVSELRMNFKEWPDLLPIVQSVLNNAPSPARANVAPITAFLGREPTSPVSVFLRSTDLSTVTVSETAVERSFNVDKLKDRLEELHPLVQNALEANRDRSRQAASRGKLPNFVPGDFVLVARSDFQKGQKLALRWRGPVVLSKRSMTMSTAWRISAMGPSPTCT